MLSFWSSWLSIKWRKNAENEQGEKAGYFWSLISYESRYLRSLNFIRLLRVVITPSLSEIKFRMKFRLTICQDSREGGRRLRLFFSRSLTSRYTPLSERLEQAWKHIDWSPLSGPAGKEGNKSWHEQLTQKVHAEENTFWTSLGIASLYQRDFLFRKLSRWIVLLLKKIT